IYRLARPGWSGEQEREPLRLLQDLLEPPAAVHEALVAEFRERVEQSFPGRFRQDDVFERETRLDRLGHGSRRLMDVGLRRLPIVVGLVDLDAGIEEAEDSANVIPGYVAARLTDPAALRALHNPFVPVLFAHPQTSESESGDDPAKCSARKHSPGYLNIARPRDFRFPPRRELAGHLDREVEVVSGD